MKPLLVLRDRSDWRPVTLVALCVAVSLVPFFVSMPLWGVGLVWIGSVYLRTFTAFAQHNHAHLKVFSMSTLNHGYDVLLAQCTGYPTALWELHHVRGHHRHFLRPDQDVAGIIQPKTGKVVSRVWYAVRGNLTIHRDSVRIGWAERRAGRRSLLDKLGMQVGVQSAITVALFLLNPWWALAFFIVPNMANAFLIWWVSHSHHRDVPGQSIYDGSVTVLGRHFNFQTFNIGHHTAHHEKPTLHWSQLPMRTRAIRDRIPDVCVRNG